MGNLRIFSSGEAHIIDAKLRANTDTVLRSPAFLIPVTTPCLAYWSPGPGIARHCPLLPLVEGFFKSSPGTPDPADPLITMTAIIVNAY